MKNVLGDSGMQAVMFHLKVTQVKDPKEIHQKLSSTFQMGVSVLEKAIVRELFSQMKIPYGGSDQFDFLQEVADAYTAFRNSGWESRS